MWFISGVQKSSIKVGDRVRVKPTITTPQYKWGSVTHTSVGLVTSISPNGRDLTVDFPMHSNWAGLTSEMEVVPCYHPGVTCNGCGLGPIAGRLNYFRVNFSFTIFTEIKDGAALYFFLLNITAYIQFRICWTFFFKIDTVTRAFRHA